MLHPQVSPHSLKCQEYATEGLIFYVGEMLVFYNFDPVSAYRVSYCSACLAPVICEMIVEIFPVMFCDKAILNRSLSWQTLFFVWLSSCTSLRTPLSEVLGFPDLDGSNWQADHNDRDGTCMGKHILGSLAHQRIQMMEHAGLLEIFQHQAEIFIDKEISFIDKASRQQENTVIASGTFAKICFINSKENRFSNTFTIVYYHDCF